MHGQLDTALVGLRGLAQQQRGQDRFADRLHHLVGEGLGQFQLGGGELHRLLRPAQLDQRDHGVQPVGGLVRLRAQRLGEAALGVQLAGERLQLGVVAQGDDGAALLPGGDRRGVDHQHPVGAQVDLVDARLGRQQRPRQRGRQPQRVGPVAHPALRGEAEELPCPVVDQRDPALPVEHHQPLADRVQGRLVVGVHVAELGGVHVVGVPAQPRVDDVGADPADRQRQPAHRQQGEHLVAQPGRDLVDRDPRADQPDHLAVGVDRGDHPHRGAERAGVRLLERAAAQGLLGVAEEARAYLALVGVGPADAAGVHDGDEVDVGVAADLLGVRLEKARGIAARLDRLADRGGVGDGAGRRARLAARRLLGLAAVGEEREQDTAEDQQAHQEHLHREELTSEAAGTGEGHAGQSAWPDVCELNERKGDRPHSLRKSRRTAST